MLIYLLNSIPTISTPLRGHYLIATITAIVIFSGVVAVTKIRAVIQSVFYVSVFAFY
jgi:hypothetical protein